ncbi:hypothetical protein DDZ16_14760 [Marinilabilia rubra]|uniref:Uncharacterized protein n=1 Tax=Marinilabilia rubra TaxID=2162893 RepID=A0A2U2B6P4_9BACT|nr:hypothetical protein DDZ16_14760 [Marinilabilia rubra]
MLNKINGSFKYNGLVLLIPAGPLIHMRWMYAYPANSPQSVEYRHPVNSFPLPLSTRSVDY